MGQVGAVLAAAKRVEVVQRLHASQGVGDHGDGAGRHQGDVVGRAAQGQRVVGGAGESQRVVTLQGLALVVVLVLQLLLLHLQGHQLFVLQVGHVVGGGRRRASRGGAALRGGHVPVGLVAPLVLLVVERCEGQDVEEEQRGPHSDGDAQLRGVVSFGFDDHRGLVGQVAALPLVRGLLDVHRGNAWVAGGGRPVVFTWEAFGVRVGGGVLWWDLGGGGDVLEEPVDIMEMWNQLQPESHLRSPVVVSHSRFETYV